MTTLQYHANAMVEDLALNECVMRSAVLPNGVRFWHLWFYVARETDGQPEAFCVPMNPRGGWLENGPGGKTWGLADCGGGRWQVSPSINVLQTREVHPGEHETVGSLWHQTPDIVGVSATESWTTGAAP